VSGHKQKPVLAVFDFDGTITYFDSLLPFLRSISGPGKFAGKLLLCGPAFLAFGCGLITPESAKVRVLKRFLGAVAEAELASQAESYASGKLKRLVKAEAMDRIRWHQARGDRTVVLSASLQDYIRPWARSEGISDVVCTRLRCADGRIMGDLDGPNCHGEEKVRRLKEAFGDLSQYEIYAYGDSRSDRAVLCLAQHRFYRSFEPKSLRAKVRKYLLLWRAITK